MDSQVLAIGPFDCLLKDLPGAMALHRACQELQSAKTQMPAKRAPGSPWLRVKARSTIASEDVSGMRHVLIETVRRAFALGRYWPASPRFFALIFAVGGQTRCVPVYTNREKDLGQNCAQFSRKKIGASSAP
jgi:hypothetical protein